MPINMKAYFGGLALILACFIGHVVGQDLKGELEGKGLTALFPGDPAYKNARRAYNRRFDLYPVAVVYPENAQQVAAAVQFGPSSHLQFSARSGGHSYIANGLGGDDGALVIDLSLLKNITVDANNGTAVIPPGARLGAVALALNDQGRALPHGTCPYVGLGGHASFGGFGLASRMWGLTLDRIVSVEVVLANGTIVTASNSTNTDLFWAMCGAGPSFGITTAFTFVTEPVPSSAYAFRYNWTHLPADDFARIVSAYQNFVLTDLPPYFDAELNIRPGDLPGTVTAEMQGGWYGNILDLNATVQPLLDTVPIQPNVTIADGTWLETLVDFAGSSLNTSAPDTSDTFYIKSLMTPEDSPMSEEAISAFASYVTSEGHKTSTIWFAEIELYGGPNSAINAVPLDATAFAHRSSLFTIQFYASSPNSQPPYPDEGCSFLDGMVSSIINNSPSNWNYGAYTNYIDDILKNPSSLYYATHYKRLQDIKKEVDPNNVFHFKTSIGESR